MRKNKFQWVLFLCIFQVVSAHAQDTLRLTIDQVEEQFLKTNLQLIATKLGIEENKAYEIQAKLFPNPVVSVETMPYNSKYKTIFPMIGDAGKAEGDGATQNVQIQQLFLLGKKREKQVALAQTNTILAEDKFYDLLRNLRYQLHITFWDIYYNQETIKLYDLGIANLQSTVNLFQEQYEKGNIPLKDLARLKAYLFSLSNERQVYLKEQVEDQAILGTLLSLKRGVVLDAIQDRERLTNLSPDNLTISDLITTAEDGRYDLRIAKDAARSEEQNLILQKALAIPDITAGLNYQRGGSLIPNYWGVNVTLPIPLFNKNQGNVKAAQVRVQSSTINAQSTQLQVEKDVERAFIKAKQADKVFKTFDNKFNQDFAQLIKGVEENYQKRNIGIVEFIDFFDAYKATVVAYSQLQNDRMQFFENLNYTVGKPVIGK